MTHSKIHITPTIALGWLAAIGAVVVGVAPILPPDAPAWLHTWLPFIGLAIALLTQSVRRISPTPAEAETITILNPGLPLSAVRVNFAGGVIAAAADAQLPPVEPQ